MPWKVALKRKKKANQILSLPFLKTFKCFPFFSGNKPKSLPSPRKASRSQLTPLLPLWPTSAFQVLPQAKVFRSPRPSIVCSLKLDPLLLPHPFLGISGLCKSVTSSLSRPCFHDIPRAPRLPYRTESG